MIIDRLKKEIGAFNFGIEIRSKSLDHFGFHPSFGMWSFRLISFPKPGGMFRKENYKGFWWRFEINPIVCMRSVQLPRFGVRIVPRGVKSKIVGINKIYETKYLNISRLYFWFRRTGPGHRIVSFPIHLKLSFYRG